jgi:hypothetical protein
MQRAFFGFLDNMQNYSQPGSPRRTVSSSHSPARYATNCPIEIFFTLEEAKTLIARWREEYNHIRPHSAYGYHPFATQAWLLVQQQAIASSLS